MSEKNLIVIFLLLVSGFAGYSQNDWRAGYIIENSGDTIYGQIDYRSPGSNSQYSYFRESERDKPAKYPPTQIKGYRYLNDKNYISKTVRIDEVERMVFLESLFEGRANLYFYKDDDEKYFLEVDDQIHELKNTERRIYNEGTAYLKDQKEYIGVMNNLFKEADMSEDIARTQLKHRSLIEITRKYHNKVSTDEESVVYEKKIKPTKIDFGFVYGNYNKTLHLEEFAIYRLESGFSDYFGLAVNLQNIPGVYERFSLQLEALAFEYYLFNEKRYQLNVPLLLDYRISSKKFYPKVEVGTSMYFTRSDQINTQHITFMAGLSFHYEFFKDNRVFIQARIENNPGIVRIGGGLLF